MPESMSSEFALLSLGFGSMSCKTVWVRHGGTIIDMFEFAICVAALAK